MTPDAIFLPLAAMIGLTFAVALWMLALRIGAVRNRQLPARYFLLNRGAKEPERLAQVTQNFHNLLETPPLFYAALLVIYVTGHVDQVYLYLAWTYVVFRVLHTGVHTTSNVLLARLLVFLASVAVLGVLWVRITGQLLAA